jgi:hypothetical protein
MKKLLLSLTLCLALPAFADELADADRLLARKAIPEAMRLYTKLGNSGNPAAQQRLGELYLNGDAGQVDEAKAEAWFAKAAAKGNTGASAALERLKGRAAHRGEIDYWLKQYDGEDLRADGARCVVPRLPAVSKQNDEIDRIGAKIDKWQDCYNNHIATLNEAAPLDKRMPAGIAALLTPAETAAAAARFDSALAAAKDDARIGSKLVLADIAAWRSATNAYVAEHNAIVQSGPSPERARDIEARRSNYSQPAR